MFLKPKFVAQNPTKSSIRTYITFNQRHDFVSQLRDTHLKVLGCIDNSDDMEQCRYTLTHIGLKVIKLNEELLDNRLTANQLVRRCDYQDDVAHIRGWWNGAKHYMVKINFPLTPPQKTAVEDLDVLICELDKV